MTYQVGQWGGYARDCHAGPVLVMTIGKSNIWAGNLKEISRETWDLRIRISDTGAFGAATSVMLDRKTKALFGDLLEDLDTSPTIDIQWPDFDAPEMGWQWWENLVKCIESMPKGSDVGIHCQGGHGRTGTALAILAALSSQTATDPVAWVREHYCEDAVESSIQLDYVQDITGIKVTAESAWRQKQNKLKDQVPEGSNFAHAPFDPSMPTWRQLPDGKWVMVKDEQFQKMIDSALTEHTEHDSGTGTVTLSDPS